MEYGIQALAGIGMVFAVITDLWQKKIAVYVIFTITIVLLLCNFVVETDSYGLFARKRQYFLYDQFADKRKNRKRRCIFIWNDRSSNGIMEKCHDHLYQFYACFCCCIISDYFTQKK